MFHQVLPRSLKVSRALCLWDNAMASATSPEFNKKKRIVNPASAATNINALPLRVGSGPATNRTNDASQTERQGAARLNGVRVQSTLRRSTETFPESTKASRNTRI